MGKRPGNLFRSFGLHIDARSTKEKPRKAVVSKRTGKITDKNRCLCFHLIPWANRLPWETELAYQNMMDKLKKKYGSDQITVEKGEDGHTIIRIHGLAK